jgi:hypothetical protein
MDRKAPSGLTQRRCLQGARLWHSWPSPGCVSWETRRTSLGVREELLTTWRLWLGFDSGFELRRIQ